MGSSSPRAPRHKAPCPSISANASATYRYALTDKGTALVPLIEDMRTYGSRWLPQDQREPAAATV